MLNTVLSKVVPTNPSCGKPHRDEHSNELGQSERVFVDCFPHNYFEYLMEVDNLRTLRYCKMSGMDIKRRTLRKRRPAPGGNVDKLKVDLTDPSAVKEDADKHGRDGEVVDEAADLEHEVELVRRRHKL